MLLLLLLPRRHLLRKKSSDGRLPSSVRSLEDAIRVANELAVARAELERDYVQKDLKEEQR